VEVSEGFWGLGFWGLETARGGEAEDGTTVGGGDARAPATARGEEQVRWVGGRYIMLGNAREAISFEGRA